MGPDGTFASRTGDSRSAYIDSWKAMLNVNVHRTCKGCTSGQASKQTVQSACRKWSIFLPQSSRKVGRDKNFVNDLASIRSTSGKRRKEGWMEKVNIHACQKSHRKIGSDGQIEGGNFTG